MCWLLVPETLRGLLRQRLHWARGGIEARLSNRRRLFSLGALRM